MVGYKAFDKNLRCRNFQYEVGKIYELDGELEVCKNGFHFCKTVADCYDYYPMESDTVICRIEALGNIAQEENKFATDKILICEKLDELEKKGNANGTSTGYLNTGNWNTGTLNTGDLNTGNKNTGYRNAGDSNTGDYNTGNGNAGGRNTGNYNAGYMNIGNHNSGDHNVGNHNIGYYNAGSWNTGDWNAGDYNDGNCNSGSWNTGNYSSGCFCTKEAEMLLFDKPSGMLSSTFYRTEIYHLLKQMPENNQERQSWYDSLCDFKKNLIKTMPNFDSEKFFECTGIQV